jgi:large subunit ribosomal protein L17
MRHQRSGKKLGRDSAHRKALYSNLAGALIEHGRIQTTEAKAKAVKPFAEKMITLGKRGDLHARRQALAALRSNNVVHQLFADVAPRFADGPAATPASSASASVRATQPRWSTSSSSTSSPSRRRSPDAARATAEEPEAQDEE